MELEASEGYVNLLHAVTQDKVNKTIIDIHECDEKLQWVVERAKHYASVFNVPVNKIIDVWEKKRNYWYMNYYQDANQPLLSGDNVRLFETLKAAEASFQDQGFRCPQCKSVSNNPYECQDEICGWKSYGFLGTLNDGIYLAIKEKLAIEEIFMPVAWESSAHSY